MRIITIVEDAGIDLIVTLKEVIKDLERGKKSGISPMWKIQEVGGQQNGFFE